MATKGKQRLPARAVLTVFAADDTAGICDFYEENGLVLVSVIDSGTCAELIAEQWREILLKQQWSEMYKLKVKGAGGRELDVGHSASASRCCQTSRIHSP